MTRLGFSIIIWLLSQTLAANEFVEPSKGGIATPADEIEPITDGHNFAIWRKDRAGNKTPAVVIDSDKDKIDLRGHTNLKSLSINQKPVISDDGRWLGQALTSENVSKGSIGAHHLKNEVWHTVWESGEGFIADTTKSRIRNLPIDGSYNWHRVGGNVLLNFRMKVTSRKATWPITLFFPIPNLEQHTGSIAISDETGKVVGLESVRAFCTPAGPLFPYKCFAQIHFGSNSRDSPFAGHLPQGYSYTGFISYTTTAPIPN